MKKPLLLLSLLGLCSIAGAGEIAKWREQSDRNSRPTYVEHQTPDEMNDPKKGISLIGIERTPCFGSCPVYSAFIHQDGSVDYEGEQHVKRMGKFKGQIDPWYFARLAQFIQQSEYAYLANDYSSTATDGSAAYTMVKMNGKIKTVRNYRESGPNKLWAIEQLIDKTVEESNLVPVKPEEKTAQ